ncbi:DUF7344 domain-containing protein [Halorussus marinus]|uniref:DUF7344 domain-containing protein n=1 Tax=Halorussus marinus TaxID=2505976 RepID=UPI001092404B|nr:hypothetical protein [Halorussus marinus]
MNTELLERTQSQDATDEDSDRDRDRELSREVVFEMLSNQRRRYVVDYLLAREGLAELRDLSRTVAARENDKRPEAVTAEERRRAYNALQQVHLPKMDDAGLVEYDADRSTLAATDDLEELQVYLEVVPGNEIPWSQYYVLLGLLCGSVTVAAWAGTPPFGSLPGLAIAAGASLLVTVSGVAHVYHNREMRLGGGDRPPSA